jgi:Zn-finger nucleic acid-binding protein
MNCPNDGNQLQMTERQGIEIDYCPQCRGVWLDRGELDKLIERSSAFVQPSPTQREGERLAQEGRYQRYDDDDDDYRRGRRREGFFGDLFDF